METTSTENSSNMLDNIKSQMRKGMLEYCILLILAQKASYATDLLTKLKEVNLLVVEGTLYPLLTRLKNAGILSYYWEESPQGPPRKYFRITPMGQQLLDDLEKEWDSLVQTTSVLKKYSL